MTDFGLGLILLVVFLGGILWYLYFPRFVFSVVSMATLAYYRAKARVENPHLFSGDEHGEGEGETREKEEKVHNY